MLARARVLTIGATMLPSVGGVSDVRVVYSVKAMASDPRGGDLYRPHRLAGSAGHRRAARLVLHRRILSVEAGLETLLDLHRQGYVVVTAFDDRFLGGAAR